MQRELEGAGFEVIRTTFSARHYGSKAERVRWWLVVFDLAPSVNPYERASDREQFFTIFDNIKIPSEALPVEDIFLFACGHDVVFWGSPGTHESSRSLGFPLIPCEPLESVIDYLSLPRSDRPTGGRPHRLADFGGF